MPSTFDAARDEIQAAFTVAWDAGTPAVTGTTAPEIFYEGVARGTKGTNLVDDSEPPHDAAWTRIFIRHNLGEQATLSDESGVRRFEKFGTITIQVFAPLAEGTGGSPPSFAGLLAEVAKSAFEGKRTLPGNVWFRDVRINEVGVSGPWFQVNVLAEFRYDELV